MLWTLLFSLIIAAEPPPAQKQVLDDILARADKANQTAMDSLKNYSYEFTEKMVFNELDKNGNAKKADTTITLVIIKNGEETSRKILYSTSGEKDKPEKENNTKKDDDHEVSVGISGELSPDNPDYTYGLIDSTDRDYVISVTPKKAKPDEGQVKGNYYIDKKSFLYRSMDVEIPRPQRAKEMKMRIDFRQLPEGPFVMTNMSMLGRAKALLGIIDIRFKVVGEFYDYRVINQETVKGE
jgi:hypothetical protein